MSNLQPPDPQKQAFSPPGSGPNGSPDPLEKLHKMSRTAGVGTEDYVAVNSVAVVAALLGIASALALFDRVLLVIPVAGIVCGIIATYQIAHSNGTQTGRGMAWLGLILSILFMCGQVGRQIIGGMQTRADRQAIMDLIEQFGQKLSREDFDGAYDMTGKRFQERVSRDEFTGSFKARFRHPSHGKITSLQSNGLIDFDSDESGENRRATAIAIAGLDRGDDRQSMIFLKAGQHWGIEDLPTWFGATGPARPRRTE